MKSNFRGWLYMMLYLLEKAQLTLYMKSYFRGWLYMMVFVYLSVGGRLGTHFVTAFFTTC